MSDLPVGGIETVTVLFTDMVDSTAISSRLDPIAADLLRRRHFSVLREAVGAAGGTEVKNLGDGLMVAFATCSAAVSCAVAMQQAVDRANLSADTPLGLRVGLSAGEATKEGADFFGDPVVEAARLCATANGGQILASSIVRSVAGRRAQHSFSPVGFLELKGLPEPVDTVEVLWEPLAIPKSPAIDDVPLPARLQQRRPSGFVGRHLELEAIDGALKAAAAGNGCQIAFVCGEAGIGKTTLVAEVARTAHAGGACVLFGRCGEEAGVAYQPFAEALGHYAAHCPPEILQNHIDEYGPDLCRLLPNLERRLGDIPPARSTDLETSRYLLFASVVGLLATISERQLLVLVLDDLHWADKTSLQLLRHVLTSPDAQRLLVVASYRNAELTHGHPMSEVLAALHRESGFRRIDLDGLAGNEVVDLMRASAGHDLDDSGIALAHALRSETDGNPFFVWEMLRHLAETGAIYQDGRGRWRAGADLEAAGLPQSVREVVGARVARLGGPSERALAVAAVIGRDFELETLARASDLAEEQLLEVLDGATAASLVREVAGSAGRYSFTHALIQHTLYQGLGAARRARVHRRVAEALEELGGMNPGTRVADLARHWGAATQSVDVTKAFYYSRQAAEAALEALAPNEAAHYFSQTLDLHSQLAEPDAMVRTDLLIGLGTAQRQSGDPEYRSTLLDAAHTAAEHGDAQRLVAAALAADRGFYSSLGRLDVDRVAVVEAALAALPDADSTARARLLAVLAIELTWGSPLARRAELAEEAVGMARRIGDPATIIHVANKVSMAIQVPTTLDQRLAYSSDALDLARQLSDPVLLHWAAATRSITAVQAGLADEINEDFRLMASAADQLREPALLWHSKFRLASQALLVGDPDHAEQLACEARDIGTASGQPDASAFFSPQIAMVRWQQGRMGEIVPIVANTVAHVPSMPVFVAVLALAHSDVDQRAEAVQLLEDASASAFRNLPLNQTWISTLACWSEVAVEYRVQEAAAALFELLQPFHQQSCYDRPTFSGFVAHYLGGLATVLGRYAEAESYFAAAGNSAVRMGAKWAAARTQLAWGRMLVTRSASGDWDRAQTMLTEARAVAAAHGYATVERRAQAALAAACGHGH